MLVDDALDHHIHARRRFERATAGWGGDTQDGGSEQQSSAHAAEYRLHFLADLARIAAQVRTKERAPDDRQGQRGHVLLHIDGLPVPPRRLMCRGEGDHVDGVRRNAITVEGWLHEPTIAQVYVALAREQSIAQNDLGPLESTALHRLSAVGDEDVHDGLWIGQHVYVFAEESKVRHDGVGAFDLDHEAWRCSRGAEAAQCAHLGGARRPSDVAAAISGDRHVRMHDALSGKASSLADVDLGHAHLIIITSGAAPCRTGVIPSGGVCSSVRMRAWTTT